MKLYTLYQCRNRLCSRMSDSFRLDHRDSRYTYHFVDKEKYKVEQYKTEYVFKDFIPDNRERQWKCS